MEDLIPILVFIFFILAPLLEKILKRGKQAPPPPPQRQRPRERELPEPQPYQRRSETMSKPSSTAETGPTSGDAGSAADMLPEDLWAILTGEAPLPRTPGPVQQRDEPLERPAPVPVPKAPAPRPSAPRPDRPRREPLPSQQRAKYEEAAVDEETIARREPTGDRPARFEYVPQDYRRPLPVETLPVIVSMEELPESDEVRHSSFHRRLAALAAPSEVQRGKARVDSGLHDPGQLRRAMIVSEILGKPKGLE